MVLTQEAAPRLAGAAANSRNINDGYNKNNAGVLVVPQHRKKDKHLSINADPGKVEVLLSRESAVLLLQSFPESSLADMLHLAMMTSLECRARDVLHTISRPVLFSTPEMKRKARAALVNAAELMPFAVELLVTGKGCPVGNMSEPMLEYIRDDASIDCFETEVGGVTVQYRLYGKKGDTSHQLMDKTLIEPPESSTLLDKDLVGHIATVEPLHSAPPSTSGRTKREATDDEVDVDDSGSSLTPNKPPPLPSSDEVGSSSPPTPPLSPPPASSRDDSPPPIQQHTDDEVAVNDSGSSSKPNKPPPLPTSDEEGSSSPPTPPLSPPPASSTDDSPPPIRPPSLALLPPSPFTPPTLAPPPPPPPSTPSTFSANPLGSMFSPPLDKSGVLAVVDDILCSQRVNNDRKKTVRVLAELESGCVSGASMEWIIRGLRTVRGKREIKQRHGGLVFVGPQWGAPMYKTRNGARRLLNGVAKKHGAGTKFVVCVSRSSGNAADNVKIITGIISEPTMDAPAAEQAPLPESDTARIEPVIDGNVPRLDDWSNIRGNLDDGCRLWAWVY